MTHATIIKYNNLFEERIEKIIVFGTQHIYDKSPLGKKNYTSAEKSIILEALLLRSCALWESFLENEVLNLILLEPTLFLENFDLSINTKLNLNILRAILFSDHYRDFANLEKSRSFFKKCITQRNNLFLNIDKIKIKKINFTYKIRNYLSHYSSFSKKQLLDSYKKDYNYSNFLEPGQFLLKSNGRYFEELVYNFKLVSIQMRNKL